MRSSGVCRSLTGIWRSPAQRYFPLSGVALKHTSSQTSNSEFSTLKSDNVRSLHTNHVQNPLENAGPERWSFNFGGNNKQNSISRRKEAHEPVTEESVKLSKWSTYTMPSKQTLAKQQEQGELQKKEASEKIAGHQIKKPKRKLRPRKALISLTPNAIVHLKLLLNQPEPKLIRIGVKNRGCSGLTYDLEYTSAPGKFDEVVEQDGVKVIIDSKALFSIVGSEMDWIDDRLSSRFVFKNPNSKGTCGCGESFMV
ncbi:LADA_0G03312g1_1 [Lachancea dasiensis]|uniref:Iron-sulfur assembly protein 1 n=1 Tax=Lachancea dasiensis TaxID=1072105 RepID=A0A1G4JRL4_9SACH|nr:LADA_0G03312g1_1 [Lachancea dasiensis]